MTIAQGENGLYRAGYPGRATLSTVTGFLPMSFVCSSWEIGSLESWECVFRLADKERKEREKGRVRRRDGRPKGGGSGNEFTQRKCSSWCRDL